jgi:hypothetical protein
MVVIDRNDEAELLGRREASGITKDTKQLPCC